MNPFLEEVKVARQAVQAAVKIAQHVLFDSNKGAIQKADLTPVTVADYTIQAVLAHAIHTHFPSDQLVGEESAGELNTNPNLVQHMWTVLQACDQRDDVDKIPDPSHLPKLISLCETTTSFGIDSGRVWIFDPIDGTKTFLRGEQYAINVALLVGGRQVLSVVACPLLCPSETEPIDNATISEVGCILLAVKGYGAWVQPLSGPHSGNLARLPRHADGDSVMTQDLKLVTCWNMLDSGVDDVHKAVAENLGAPFPGSDLVSWVCRWAVMALGVANITVWVYKTRSRHAKIWDHAGAMLLFEEVGGMITDVDGKDIDLTRGRKLSANFGFVAAPRSIHHRVLKAVRDTLRAQGKGELLSSTP
ncbi:hypothetical protein B0H66DRAFT_627009 [Apodospora peruviana]|uniref:Uncharacterized protein n=1 Tax=Apodospora peruviana TaxID=516989 RepID=A0AAE0HX36_9PEZI|nr:hypothetical protein B0H66DRAFT_627009 [Apodospora peruviana]